MAYLITMEGHQVDSVDAVSIARFCNPLVLNNQKICYSEIFFERTLYQAAQKSAYMGSKGRFCWGGEFCNCLYQIFA
jgi:hypothetical protein